MSKKSEAKERLVEMMKLHRSFERPMASALKNMPAAIATLAILRVWTMALEREGLSREAIRDILYEAVALNIKRVNGLDVKLSDVAGICKLQKHG